MTASYNWACFMTGIFLDSIHAIKPPIYKIPPDFTEHFPTVFFIFFSPFDCVLRYTELFIRGAEPNELLTGARFSISRPKECFIISRLSAFFGCRVAIYSSGSLHKAPQLHIGREFTFTLGEVRQRPRLVCSDTDCVRVRAESCSLQQHRHTL